MLRKIYLHHFFHLLWPKNGLWKQSDKLFQTCTLLKGILAHPFLSPTWKHTRDDKQHSDSTAVRRQNKLSVEDHARQFFQGEEFKASCDVYSVKQSAWGARWMPASALFCHAVSPVSRWSCHKYDLHMETETAHRGTCNTHLSDWRQTHFTSVNRVNVTEVCAVPDPGTILGRSVTQRMRNRCSTDEDVNRKNQH